MEVRNYTVRDGVKLSYQYYHVESPRGAVVLLHGSTYNAKRYANLAKAVQRLGFSAFLLDWRGHGQSEGRRGDVDYIGQLEDDLADFVEHYKAICSTPMILVGHSAGAVVCLRYIVKYGCEHIAALNLIAPAINGPLEAVRYEQSGADLQFRIRNFRQAPAKPPVDPKALAQAQKFAPKLMLFKFWSAKLVPFLRHQTALRFPANEKVAQLEGRVLDYSYRLMMSCDITNYPEAFNKITVPLLLTSGQRDEILHPEFLQTVYQWHLNADLDKQLFELPNINHMAIISATAGILPKWLDERFGPRLDEQLNQGAVA